jgi:hypothetical protein
MATEWNAADFEFLKAKRGDPAWQAEWELLVILVAIDTWMTFLKDQAVVLQSDAAAALFATRRRAGRTPAMNALCAEIALRCESLQLDLREEHLRGAFNFEADALSRLSEGADVPDRLKGVSRFTPKPRTPAFYWAWPRQLLESTASAEGPANKRDA